MCSFRLAPSYNAAAPFSSCIHSPMPQPLQPSPLSGEVTSRSPSPPLWGGPAGQCSGETSNFGSESAPVLEIRHRSFADPSVVFGSGSHGTDEVLSKLNTLDHIMGTLSKQVTANQTEQMSALAEQLFERFSRSIEGVRDETAKKMESIESSVARLEARVNDLTQAQGSGRDGHEDGAPAVRREAAAASSQEGPHAALVQAMMGRMEGLVERMLQAQRPALRLQQVPPPLAEAAGRESPAGSGRRATSLPGEGGPGPERRATPSPGLGPRKDSPLSKRVRAPKDAKRSPK